MSAQLQVFVGITEELHDLLQLLFFLVGAGHILEGDLLVALRDAADPRLAEVGHLVADAAVGPAVHAGHQVHQQNEGHHRQHIGQQHLQPVGARGGGIVIGGDDALFVLLHHQIVQIVIEQGKIVDMAGGGGLILQRGGQPGVVDGKGLHLLLDEELAHLAVGNVVLTAHGAGQVHDHQQAQHQEDQGPEIHSSVHTAPPCLIRRMPCQLWLLPTLMTTKGRARMADAGI